MKEFFEQRRMTGGIKVKIGHDKYWVEEKAVVCNHIIKVIQQFSDDGYTLTLRQLYYQLVAADYIPNHDKVYKKIGRILDDLRYSGSINWASIEDRGRVPKLPYWVEGIADAINNTVRQYRLDRQKGQPVHIEVWTEKDAVSGILYRVTQRYQIRLVVNKGYSSSTAMYRAYDRFIKYINDGKKVLILYLGDHDPSGLDMVRDIDDRIRKFLIKGDRIEEAVGRWWEDPEYTFDDIADLRDEYSGVRYLDVESDDKLWDLFFAGKRDLFLEINDIFKVKQIGLTMDQIKEYNPPPNPAKMTDSRAAEYVDKYGDVSWELDALSPSVMETIVDEQILEVMDVDIYREVCEQEDEDRSELKTIQKRYEDEEE